MKYVWLAFVSLSQGRQGGMSGPQPLSYTEIKSWSDLSGCEITPFELDVLKKLDAVYIRTING